VLNIGWLNLSSGLRLGKLVKKDSLLLLIPEMLLHENRIPQKQLSLLLRYSKDHNWATKDFHLIARELEEFIISLPESEENVNELWYLLVKILFFSGNLKKLNEVYTSIIADNQEILGVTIFYALSLTFQGYSDEAAHLINRINLIKLNDQVLKIEIMGIILFYHSIKRDYKKVDSLYTQILQEINSLHELTEDQLSHLLPWVYIRKAYSIRGQKSTALKLLEKVQSDLLLYPHRFFQAMSILREGHIYHNHGDLGKALDLYDQAIDLAQEIQSWHLLSIIYNRVGFVLTAQKQLDTAKAFFQDSLNFAKKSGARWLTVGPLANLVRWKLSQGKIDEAIEDYHTFASITKSVGDEREQFYALIALAELYEQIDDIPKSKYYYSKGVSLGLKLGIFQLVNPSDIDQ
jgi:tetratricopeptide (TPR) repeat protein